MHLDTVMRLASATKIFTTIAAMQCVDQGLIGLDDNVVPLIGELKGIKIITGYNGDEPILEEPKNKITLR